jgi:hypothetical protein
MGKRDRERKERIRAGGRARAGGWPMLAQPAKTERERHRRPLPSPTYQRGRRT